MTQTKSVEEKLIDMGCRDIYLPGFVQQLYHPNTMYMVNCWGIQKKLRIKSTEDEHCRGVLLKVNGLKWNKWVYITLNFMDYYEVHLLNDMLEIHTKIEDVFCEDLVETIDKLIES
jgi:hypothetical protein